jgi:hypothetical protein
MIDIFGFQNKTCFLQWAIEYNLRKNWFDGLDISKNPQRFLQISFPKINASTLINKNTN